jgi:hypothetical protein
MDSEMERDNLGGIMTRHILASGRTDLNMEAVLGNHPMETIIMDSGLTIVKKD